MPAAATAARPPQPSPLARRPRRWHRDLSFLSADSPHFLTETYGEDKTTLRFGDGRRGKIPPNGAQIEVVYTRTLGAKGNRGSTSESGSTNLVRVVQN